MDNVLKIEMEWPARSDYRVMALVRSADGTQTMLSKFGTRRRPNEHVTQCDGVSLRDDESGLDIDASQAAGTIIAPIVYRPPRARRTFTDAPPVAHCLDMSEACEAESATVYTWVPFLVEIGDDASVEVVPYGAYSEPSSERRPKFVGDELIMDAGLLNCFQ